MMKCLRCNGFMYLESDGFTCWNCGAVALTFREKQLAEAEQAIPNRKRVAWHAGERI